MRGLGELLVDQSRGLGQARQKLLSGNRLVGVPVQLGRLDGGFQKLEYNGRDFLIDVDCQDDRIWFLNRDSIKKFGLFDLQFVEQTGGILKHDSLSAGDVFYGFMRIIANLGVVQANANSKIVDLVVDSNYVMNQ